MSTILRYGSISFHQLSKVSTPSQSRYANIRAFVTRRQKRVAAAAGSKDLTGKVNSERRNEKESMNENISLSDSYISKANVPYNHTNLKSSMDSVKHMLSSISSTSTSTSTSSLSGSISVNNEDLFDEKVHLQDKPNFNDQSLNYEQSTPLSNQLIKLIGLRGPITTADYMTMALTDPSHGYYTSKVTSSFLDDDLFNDDVYDIEHDTSSSSAIIGKYGDFTTAPEISQIFGECMLLFFVYQYRNLLKTPEAIQILEIGPGKGTLMADILVTACKSFHDFADALADGGGVHLIELSPDMRKKQEQILSEWNDKLENYEFVFVKGNSKGENKGRDKDEDKDKDKDKDDTNQKIQSSTNNLSKDTNIKKIRIYWHDALSSVPATNIHGKYIPHFILCQEFYDALPIHSFQKHSDGSWRERMIDVDVKPDKALHNGDTYLKQESILLDALPNQPKKPRLRFVLSKESTPALDTLLKLPPEYEQKTNVGDIIEICPMGLMLTEEISSRISQCQGASLIIDYGTEFGSGDTLRAFYKHEQVHPLTLPGKVDVTADVVFGSIKQEAEKVSNVTCFGPTTQGQFLSGMGAVERVTTLIDDDNTTDEQAEELFIGLERLVSPEAMGERYKILSIVSGTHQKVPGF